MIKDREKLRQYLAAYRIKNRDKLNARARARYVLNREKERLRARRFRESLGDKYLERSRLYDAKLKRRVRKAELERTEKRKAVRRAWKIKNQLQYRAYHKDYERRYRERRKELHHVKKDTDIQYRLRRTLRSRLKTAIKRDYKVSSAVDTLGCSIDGLKMYLEAQFEPDMTWHNFGLLRSSIKTWQIDHIHPLSGFDLTDQKQVRTACHFSNLRPLWALDNRRKANKSIGRKEVLNAF